jgi:subtilisin family serine protease
MKMRTTTALLPLLVVVLASAIGEAAEYVPGRVIVQLTEAAHAGPDFRADLGLQGRTGLADLDDRLAASGATRVAPALRFAPEWDSEPSRRLRRYLRVEYAVAANPADVAALLRSSPDLEHAEPEGVFRAAAIPNDPLFPQQCAHRNTGQAVAYDSTLVGIPDCDGDTDLAWDLTTGSPAIIIAVLDTGVDLAHPEFAGRLVPGYDFWNDDDDPSDDHGHGTACAGIAAAAGHNAQGVAGVAWGARIMPVKVLDHNSNGTSGSVASGIVWAVDQGARILSISIGAYHFSILEDAVAYAHAAGRPMFCAAGNGNWPGLRYPAGYTAYTIAVGALSPCNERKSPTSCDGEDWWGSNHASSMLLAPGVRIHTTDITGEDGYTPDDYTATFNGTSAATPYAAGVGALVLSLNPALTPDELKQRLQGSCEDMGEFGADPETGFGRLNAHLAVLSAFTMPTYVNAAYTGPEWGTLHRPYNTLEEGVFWAPIGGTVVVFGGRYTEALTIAKQLTILGKNGIAEVGP